MFRCVQVIVVPVEQPGNERVDNQVAFVLVEGRGVIGRFESSVEGSFVDPLTNLGRRRGTLGNVAVEEVQERVALREMLDSKACLVALIVGQSFVVVCGEELLAANLHVTRDPLAVPFVFFPVRRQAHSESHDGCDELVPGQALPEELKWGRTSRAAKWLIGNENFACSRVQAR